MLYILPPTEKSINCCIRKREAGLRVRSWVGLGEMGGEAVCLAEWGGGAQEEDGS